MTQDFDEDGFWTKVKNFALAAGKAVIENALVLHETARRPTTPAWASTVIYGALAYFVSPVDVVPDLLPGGFVDDLGVLATALGTVAMHIDDEARAAAAARVRRLFGE